MPAEPDRPGFRTIHATAVAIGDRALLLRGASRAGKSRLALALIARTTPAQPIRLIGDDRMQLLGGADGVLARPHPRIAGFIERRGLGLVAMPWVAQARVGGVVDLRISGSSLREPRNDGRDELFEMAYLMIDHDDDEDDRVDRVLAWWARLSATWAPHPPEKGDDTFPAGAKD